MGIQVKLVSCLVAGGALFVGGCAANPPALPPARPSAASPAAEQPPLRALAMHTPRLAPPGGAARRGTRRIDVALRSAANPRVPTRQR